MKQLFCYILTIFSIWSVKAQVGFTATADTNKILIGEQITVKLEAQMPEKTDFLWPVTDSLEGLELISVGKIDTVQTQGIWTITQSLVISAFDSGYYAFPQQKLILGSSPYFSEALAVAVFLPEVDEEQEMYDIKDVMDVSLNWWLIGGIICLVLLLVVAAIFGYRYFKRHKTPHYKEPKRAIPPHEWAIKSLKEIESKNLWQNNKIKQYYSEVTDVLRQYMERALALNAMESTASEIKMKLEHVAIEEHLKKEVNEALFTAEMVKFAKEKPTEETHLRIMRTVVSFIDATKPQPKAEKTP